MSWRPPAVLIALALFTAPLANPALARGPTPAPGAALQTAIDPTLDDAPEKATTLQRVKQAGASYVRLGIDWEAVAPATPPAGFEPANPDDPAYHWGEVDQLIREAVAQGLIPFMDIDGPPPWGQSPPGSGHESPNPEQLALFAQAAAARYDGSHPGLPAVRYWEVWNEPNATYFLKPQIQEGRLTSVGTYRTMVNDYADAVHRVAPEDIVIGGALFPNGFRHAEATAISPMEFSRRLFCLSAGPRPRRVCSAQVHADAWSIHPYTSGGPSTAPANPDNIWISNLGSLTKLVRAAQRLGGIVSSHRVQMWVTEFSWDSKPPDPQAVPLLLERRWVAEALYRAWSAGFSVFSWYSVHDEPFPSSEQQAGLFFTCGLPAVLECGGPKPAEEAFRFPFVAFKSASRKVALWGRTPEGHPGAVQIQWLQGKRWRSLKTLRTNRDGIFVARLALPHAANAANAMLRAVPSGGGASPPFSLFHPRDIPMTPFGA